MDAPRGLVSLVPTFGRQWTEPAAVKASNRVFGHYTSGSPAATRATSNASFADRSDNPAPPLGHPHGRMLARREQRPHVIEVRVDDLDHPVHRRHGQHGAALGRLPRDALP
jgi:hypothetical protein